MLENDPISLGRNDQVHIFVTHSFGWSESLSGYTRRTVVVVVKIPIRDRTESDATQLVCLAGNTASLRKTNTTRF